SLEGYYQETGRAGRDGKKSGCYLYYGYQDTSALRKMIDDGEGSFEQKDRQRAMLRNVIQFCENRSDCRRVQVLAYFSETFNREDCGAACDNCGSTSTFETMDLTHYAAQALSLVKQIEWKNVTLLHCVDVFRGAKSKKISNTKHDELDEYGFGSDLDRGDVERLFYRLLSENALEEWSKINKAGFATQYIKLGKDHHMFETGGRRIKIQVRVSPNGKVKPVKEPTKNQGKKRKPVHPLSTNVSSPVLAASKRRNVRKSDDGLHLNGYAQDSFVVSDLGDDEYMDSDEDEGAFEPIRIAGRPRREKRRELGPPITTDEKLQRLNPTHRMIVDDFVVHARRECQKILLSKGLRAAPFTDTVLREMAIKFSQNEAEMLNIPGIEPDKVQLYGKRFLRLVKQAQASYENILAQSDERPSDPNHRNVIDLLTSDDEDEYGEFDMDEDFSEEQHSAYFKPNAQVAAFNAQMSQSQLMPPPPRPANNAQASAPSGPNPRSTATTSRGGAPRGSRRGSGMLSRGREEGGFAKRRGTGRKGKDSGSSRITSFGGGSADEPPRRGGGGFGGISMMPT
ncbi:hypothetical protein LTR28_005709, partial [Elasticomyces elasticus]